MEQQFLIPDITILDIPDEINSNHIMPSLNRDSLYSFGATCKGIFWLYLQIVKKKADKLSLFQRYTVSDHSETQLFPLFCCGKKFQTVQFAFYTNGHEEKLERLRSQHPWLPVNEPNSTSGDSQKIALYSHSQKTLRLNEDLNVPVGLDYNSVVAIILDFYRTSYYRPMPDMSFFKLFPNLKFLVLRDIGINEDTVSTISKINSLRFVYLHRCNARDFVGFGLPFKNFKSWENIQTLRLEKCTFDDDYPLEFPSELETLKIMNCNLATRISNLNNHRGLKSLKYIDRNTCNPQELTLSKDACLISINLGFFLNHTQLTLEILNQWILDNLGSICKVTKFAIRFDYNFHDINRVVCTSPLKLELVGLMCLKELVMIDFDPRCTLTCIFDDAVKSVVTKSVYRNVTYFNGKPIGAYRFRIRPPSLTEVLIPLPTFPFILFHELAFDKFHPFLERSSILAFSCTCKTAFELWKKAQPEGIALFNA
jgi:hypothetical protein